MENREKLLEGLIILTMLKAGVKLHDDFLRDTGTLIRQLAELGIEVSDEEFVEEAEKLYQKALLEMFRRAKKAKKKG